jgi:hypothetical protein
MKRTKFFRLLGMCVSAVWLAGCVNTLDGHKKSGNPFVKDTLTGRYERPAPQVFVAAKAVIADMGTLTGDNTVVRSAEGKINDRSVWVRIEEIDPKVTQVLVQCRKKNGGADLETASEIDKRIALWLASHPSSNP